MLYSFAFIHVIHKLRVLVNCRFGNGLTLRHKSVLSPRIHSYPWHCNIYIPLLIALTDLMVDARDVSLSPFSLISFIFMQFGAFSSSEKSWVCQWVGSNFSYGSCTPQVQFEYTTSVLLKATCEHHVWGDWLSFLWIFIYVNEQC